MAAIKEARDLAKLIHERTTKTDELIPEDPGCDPLPRLLTSSRHLMTARDHAKETRARREWGKLILAPPGTGKTHWLREHPDSGWVEGDDMYPDFMRGQPRDERDLYFLSDLNHTFKGHGYHVITGDWWELDEFDAIVLPPLDLLKQRLKGQERPGHDPEEADAVIRRMNKLKKPIFTTIEDAVEFVENM